MKQIFAIFLKDARRLWPEILASLAMVAALVYSYPHGWRSASYGHAVSFRPLGLFSHTTDLWASWLLVLVPVSWLILIARMVHTEKLVGNTQFWLTRPYEWPKFLAAKLLFLACFLYVPFVLAQCMLLYEAGFQPFSYMAGLHLNLLYVTFILVLPFLAISTLTPSFGKLTLVLLGIILFIAAITIAYSALPSDLTFGGASRLSGMLSAALFTGGCGAVVLVQYARRRTHLAWLLIGATALLLAIVALVDPDRWLMGSYYPVYASNNGVPLQLGLLNNSQAQPSVSGAAEKGDVVVTLPIQILGIPDNDTVVPVALKASIQSSSGARWQSQWQSTYNGRLLPGASDTLVYFRMRRAVYDQFKSTSITLSLAVAVDEAKATTSNQLSLQVADFSVPGVGICRLPPQIGFFPGFINCRSAMRLPPLTYVTGRWVEGDCPARPADDGTILGSGWVGTLDDDPAQFGITSVWQSTVSLTNSGYEHRYDEKKPQRHLCPGSKLTFTSYRQVSSEQLNLTLTDFRLPAIPTGRYELHTSTE